MVYHHSNTLQEPEHTTQQAIPSLLTTPVGLKSAKVAVKEADAQDMVVQSPNQRVSAMQDEIKVQVALIGGQEHVLDTRLSAKVCDVKAAIHRELGHSPWQQKLILGETVLMDADAVLRDIGVAHKSTLTLIVCCQPIGQSSLETSDGKKSEILPKRCESNEPLEKFLNEFELMSWQVAFKAGAGCWLDEDCPNSGCYGVDLYWTTQSDGCRYEYWSSAPGDNEYGILVRIDANAMTAIGEGTDDGMELFSEFEEMGKTASIKQLLKEGWPRPACWKDEDEDEEDEDDEEDEEEEEEEEDEE